MIGKNVILWMVMMRENECVSSTFFSICYIEFIKMINNAWYDASGCISAQPKWCCSSRWRWSRTCGSRRVVFFNSNLVSSWCALMEPSFSRDAEYCLSCLLLCLTSRMYWWEANFHILRNILASWNLAQKELISDSISFEIMPPVPLLEFRFFIRAS